MYNMTQYNLLFLPGVRVGSKPAQDWEVKPFLRAAVINDDQFTEEISSSHVS